MSENTRSNLILKLSRQNLEVHNVDQSIWEIQNVLLKPACDETISESNEGQCQNYDTESVNAPLNTTKTNVSPHDLTSRSYALEIHNQDNNLSNIIPLAEKDPVSNHGPLQNKDYESLTNVPLDEINDTRRDLPSCSKWVGNVDIGLISKRSNSRSNSESSQSDPYGDNSDEDPDYKSNSSSSSSSSNSDHEKENQTSPGINDNSPFKKSRKRKRNAALWKKNISKSLRNSGLSYDSLKVIKENKDVSSEDKKIVKRPAKKLLPPCKEICRHKCNEKFTEEDRLNIFQEYWAMANLQRQRDFIASSMGSIAPKFARDDRRRVNHTFSFEHNNQKRRVCKVFFMATLGINTRIIRTVIEKQESSTCGIIQSEMRGKHGKHKVVPKEMKDAVRSHIKSVPRIPSHYCRARTNKEYIEGTKTIADLHRDYVELCKEEGKPSVNYQMYNEIFNNEFNISFFFPKKDACEICVQYQNSLEAEKPILQEKYDSHLLEKELSRTEKENDKLSNNNVFVYDLQSVLPCPTGNASSFYYISKLNVYNLTISNLNANNVSCYVWHEGEAHRGSNEIGSCVLHYLGILDAEAAKSDQLIDVIFYSDNCAGQNKNQYIFALYIYAVSKLKHINSITHKFLIAGHTQNEGDNIHSVIEKQILRYKKSAPIYAPDQYVTLIRQAKKTGKPYTVIEMTHDDFYDLKDLADRIGHKCYKNEKGEAIKISELKVFRVEKKQKELFLYKKSYAEKEYSTALFFNLRRKSTTNTEMVTLKKAYNKKIGISEAKKKGIITLIEKNLIPRFYSDFYNNL